MFRKLKRQQFLFEELVKRDFKKKYKRTVLGMAWSILSPLLQLLVMHIVFSQFFGQTMEHYNNIFFCGKKQITKNQICSIVVTSLSGKLG